MYRNFVVMHLSKTLVFSDHTPSPPNPSGQKALLLFEACMRSVFHSAFWKLSLVGKDLQKCNFKYSPYDMVVFGIRPECDQSLCE